MLKLTFTIVLILTLFYILRVRVVVDLLDGFAYQWNNFTVTIMTLKERHPLVFLCIPIAYLALLIPTHAKL